MPLLQKQKKQVFGQVSIDMIAGPSEILVIADGNSDAEIIGADLLSRRSMTKWLRRFW